MRDGRRYVHTLDPKSGYPIEHSLLSATVVADDCMTADAYATAFMVMGVDESKRILKSNNEIEGYLIFSTDKGLSTFSTEGISRIIHRVDVEE
jgi:thiamine biosynthesis lipoprotein